MGLRNIGVYLGLVEDEAPYDDAYGPEPEQRRDERPAARWDRAPERAAERTSVIDPIRRPAVEIPEPLVDTYRITTLHPRSYNDARAVGEHFRESTPVIMNLTEMDDADAKRLVDFAAGLVFGLRGTIERVTQKVFLLSPANVHVTAEDKAQIAEKGFFNQS
ncbi:MAG: cell division inhibitor SepF [Frankiaceae bacterium]|jgi:cell division inhibitor SepF|nr:cell division inhibitor SepF [Frankiaceae bacterium]MDQ1727196.1 cell division inhibitor SepF [Frankiaceae bacterium]